MIFLTSFPPKILEHNFYFFGDTGFAMFGDHLAVNPDGLTLIIYLLE